MKAPVHVFKKSPLLLGRQGEKSLACIAKPKISQSFCVIVFRLTKYTKKFLFSQIYRINTKYFPLINKRHFMHEYGLVKRVERCVISYIIITRQVYMTTRSVRNIHSRKK